MCFFFHILLPRYVHIFRTSHHSLKRSDSKTLAVHVVLWEAYIQRDSSVIHTNRRGGVVYSLATFLMFHHIIPTFFYRNKSTT